MNSLFIKDFRYGLDTRKSELTQRPGTLEELTNGFINQGGEIQNRKAFVRTARVAGSFGLQPTYAGLYNFGSSDLAANHPVNIGTVGIPIYVYYQRLQHPAVLFGAVYSAGSHAMTAVTFSEQFRGKAVVAATFADGNTFAYYDGTLIRDFTDGLLMAHLSTNTLIADEIEDMVNRTGVYTATKPSATQVNITGPVGEAYSIDVTETSAAGTLVGAKVSDPIGAVGAAGAIGSFEIVAGSFSAGNNKITKVEVNGVTITNAAVDWTNSNEFTASLLAQSINTKASTPEYTAEANGAVVTIKAETSQGDTPNNFEVKTTCAGDVCVGRARFQIQYASGTFTIVNLMVNGVDILGGSIVVTDTAAAATAVVNAVNTNTGTHGYLANATGSIVSVSKAVTSSSDANIPIYFVTTSSPINVGNGVFEVNSGEGSVQGISALLVYLGATRSGQQGGTAYWYHRYSLTISGGTTPYLAPVWFGAPVTLVGGTTYQSFATYPIGSTPPPPHVYCVVTDSGGQSVNSNTL